MNIREAEEMLEYELSVKRRALEYIQENADDFDDDEEIDMDELCRSIAEEDEYNFQRNEENSLRNAWQQDLIDMYRMER